MSIALAEWMLVHPYPTAAPHSHSIMPFNHHYPAKLWHLSGSKLLKYGHLIKIKDGHQILKLLVEAHQ